MIRLPFAPRPARIYTLGARVRTFGTRALLLCCALGFAGNLSAQAQPAVATAGAPRATHTFAIGENDFLLDGRPLQIRCGEIHLARVPREYWRHRLQLCRAMGLNTVCAYLFWNLHEFERSRYDWSGQADAAEFCRIAQEEGLWVILRPGPYACAEWDGGGLPWWLLKKPDMALRSQDPDFLAASSAWLREVGRVLGPLQVTRGGPLLLVQVENEYGFYGKDAEYMGKMRQATLDAGFDVPLFACNPTGNLRNGLRADLFNVVNFGRDPENGFKALRAVQPTGPLMCGEFYPGWFDTWGAPHHLGNTPRYLADLEYMLKQGASFSIYMAHGGTTFGLWAGADRPFKPDTSSYDYDAPISEAGWIGEKFRLTRELLSRYLAPGEKLPEPPPALPTTAIPAFTLTESAPLFANLPAAIADQAPRHMEAYDHGQGCIVYRTTLPAGPELTLQVQQAHDFAWVFLDGAEIGSLDRRSRRYQLKIPARSAPAQLDLLVEAMGHVNFGKEIHDRKGLHGSVRFVSADGSAFAHNSTWQVFPLRLDAAQLTSLQWKKSPDTAKPQPAFWRGSFDLATPADTFLDLSHWGKGVVWINGHCLARFWNIGPTQTAFVPGVWLRAGRNDVIVLDLLGPAQPTLAGLEKPILDRLRLDLDFSRKGRVKTRIQLSGTAPVHTGAFTAGPEMQEIRFPAPLTGRQFCFEALSAHDGKHIAALAELDVLGTDGQPLSHVNWTLVHADSEELSAEDGSASNAIDGQTANAWQTASTPSPAPYPHRLVIDLGEDARIGGFRYVPRAGQGPGRIKDYRIYVGPKLVEPVEN